MRFCGARFAGMHGPELRLRLKDLRSLSCLPANELQCSFAQHVGIALAVTGTLDERIGDGLLDVVVAV
jgi:hypothetical protein